MINFVIMLKKWKKQILSILGEKMIFLADFCPNMTKVKTGQLPAQRDPSLVKNLPKPF